MLTGVMWEEGCAIQSPGNKRMKDAGVCEKTEAGNRKPTFALDMCLVFGAYGVFQDPRRNAVNLTSLSKYSIAG